MKVAPTLLCGVLLSSVAGAPQPLTQLVTKLDNLAKAAEEEGKTEAVAYTKYQYWCKTEIATSTEAIDDEVAKIDMLTDEMEALTQEKGTLTSQIKELDTELASLGTSKTEADRVQGSTVTLDSAKRTELTATIQAMTDCLTKLNNAQATTSAAALLEIAQKHVPDFLGLVALNNPNVLAAGDEAKHVKKWVFKSGGVIELLKQLKLKFEDDLIQLNQESTNSLNAHALATQERAHALKAAQDARDAKSGRLSDVDQALLDKKGKKDTAAGELTTAKTSLKNTNTACSQKEFEWEARSKVRAGEIAALQEASKILAEVSGVRHVAVEAPRAPDAVVSFLQSSLSPSDPRLRAVAFLKQRAKSLHAKALERLAQQLSAHANDPFAEVTNMIEKMIFRLLAEQKNEDEHKQWCDQELKITSASLDDKQSRIDVLKAKILADTTAVGGLVNEVTIDTAMVRKITDFMTSATEIRAIGKKENAISIKDAQDAQTALSNAIAVLTEYYKSTGNIAKEAWEFVQAAPPVTWTGSYTGGSVSTGTESTTVITLLKTCSEEFAKMEGNTVAQEVQDQESYDSIMQTHKIEKAKKLESIDVKTNEKQRLAGRIASMTTAKKHLSDEHAATAQYQTDLEPACVTGDSTYVDRKSARSKEIQALEDAQDILGKVLTSKNFLQVSVHRQVAA